MLRFLESMQWVLFIFFTAAYAYQIFYLLVGLWGKQRGGVENARAAPLRGDHFGTQGVRRYRQTDPHLEGAGIIRQICSMSCVADNCTDKYP